MVNEGHKVEKERLEMQEADKEGRSSSACNRIAPIRCIVKLGGAAITCKKKLETIHEENLRTVSMQLRETMCSQSLAGKTLGMDWSKRQGVSVIASPVDEYRDVPSLDCSRFVVVHGAGSFGHFQASQSGVHRGGMDQPLVKAGFVATRISVTTLNLEIVRALATEGIPSVGMSPFSCGWSTCKRNISSAPLSGVQNAINNGFVPVMHGDAVFDESLGCTILSGDVIISHLAAHLMPKYVVFLTDVLGVYDRPPSDADAVLLKEIVVDEQENWSVLKPALQNMNSEAIETSVADHDTTGGMLTKVAEAASIAKLGVTVYIVKVATPYSIKALSGELLNVVPDDWLGTIICRKNKD
ncbi:unnamed protein product [Rhodiola kirilowii]